MTKKRTHRNFICRAAYLAAILAAGLFLSAEAQAQRVLAPTPQFEVAGAYSYVRANSAGSSNSFNLQGGSGSLAYNLSDRFSAVADVGAYRFSGLPGGVDSTMYTYLFGPRIAFRKFVHLRPFAQVLLGGGRLNASSSGISAGENTFAMAAGGGFDVPIGRRFVLRPIQADYLLTRFPAPSGASASQNNLRLSAGLVLSFGHH